MTPKYLPGQRVRMNDGIIADCPKYTDIRYEIAALACSGWEIGRAEWHGEYSIRNIASGHTAIAYESSLVAV